MNEQDTDRTNPEGCTHGWKHAHTPKNTPKVTTKSSSTEAGLTKMNWLTDYNKFILWHLL
jgi:hypothetical protein